MKWKTDYKFLSFLKRKTVSEKISRNRILANWHNWFAWYPVKTEDDIWVWLETVQRKAQLVLFETVIDFWYYRTLD
jgi:hypothetical protein